MASQVDNGAEGNSENGAANGADQPIINLVSQYVKDMSVENPGAPESYSWAGQPEIDLQVNIASRAVSEGVHETELKIGATARHAEGVAFAVELSYCGLFALRNIPDDMGHHFMFAEAPRLIFPFARRILADAVRDAGYPPLMLEPIDFHALYMQQRAQHEQQAASIPPAGEA